MRDTSVFERTLSRMQEANAALYQAMETHREQGKDPVLIQWMQEKLAKEYQYIAELWHWLCLERYASIDELVIPDNLLDEHDAVKYATTWIYHRDIWLLRMSRLKVCP